MRAHATKADLAFVDAAIRVLQASRAEPEGIALDASDPACGDVVITATVISTTQYTIFTSTGIGGDSAALQLARRLQLEPTVSLEHWIAARNRFAAALGEDEL